jgi:hypothetical protein
MVSPEENNERQMIHDHTSILLGEFEPAAVSASTPVRGVANPAGATPASARMGAKRP